MGSPAPFELPPRPALSFGPGARRALPALARSLASSGSRGTGDGVLLLTGAAALDRNGMAAELEHGLSASGLAVIRRSLSGEPSVDVIDALAREAVGCALIVAAGGGSVLDAGKAAAAMARTGGSVRDYLEGVGSRNHPGGRLPWIALPCTAGTGAEATTNAVITGRDDAGRPFKRSLRHPSLIPNAAILDGELCLGQGGPPAMRRAMDALSQLLEAFTSRRANPLTDALVMAGLEALGRGLPRLIGGDEGVDAWGDLLLAAHCSGIGLASAGLGLPHGLAGPLGAATGLGHAEIVARVLHPCFVEAIDASRRSIASGTDGSRDSHGFLDRCTRAAAALGLARAEAGTNQAAEALLRGLDEWRRACGLPGLIEAGVDPALLQTVAESAGKRDSLSPLDAHAALRVLSACA